ncbi:hypothetical protein [Phenylobacterium sp.]|uniref:hypothetical protein n=1 Tax=Phenylobacterium sp. TaxID=1871053 RepID=UPI0025E35213|nr:hypothetical protein [Phenylobacterium sp.]
MSVAAILIATSMVAGAPLAVEAERTSIRCAPAPYYVADRQDRAAAARPAWRPIADKGTRPCYLTRGLRPGPARLTSA